VKILVVGGTGTVGSQLTSRLVAKGYAVRVLTRSKDRAEHLPSGVEIAVGDLREPSSARPAFDGVGAVFVLNGVTQTEANEGIACVALASAARARRLVYLSVHGLDGAPQVPRFGCKIGVEAAVRASGVPFTILQPNNFFQNDYWLKEALVERGFYGQPFGQKGLHRVDTRDIADAALNALTTDKFANQTYVIAGPTLVNGPSIVEVWSSKLGRAVAYGGDDLDAWERRLSSMMPSWARLDTRMMYAHFQTNGLIATPDELAACEEIVGHPLRTFDAFAAEMAAAWRG
jgi:uncharacterized protein YbjT (DUF2867 family)